MKKIPTEKRFWNRVDKNGPIPDHCKDLGNCWLWKGFKNPKGYGNIIHNGRIQLTSRVSWILHYGEITQEKRVVCHHCDNPSCVNPNHLFIGSHSDNAKDAVKKGRLVLNCQYGEDHYKTKLTWEDVRFIRENKNKLTRKQLEQKYNVSKGCIALIIRNINWKEEKK